MRIRLLTVGRLKQGPERDLYARYADRLDKAGRGVSIGPLELVQINESRASATDTRKDDEAARLLAAGRPGELRIVLDETGKGISSEAFAKMLARHRDAGVPDLSFLIGGPDGHGASVRDSAQLLLGLGPMTLPHGLARIVLVEQIYRAITIISGHPYHRS